MNSFINNHISEVRADEQKLKGYIKSFVNYINGISGIPEFYVMITGDTTVAVFKEYSHTPLVDIDFYLYHNKREDEPHSTLRLNLSTNQKDIASITINYIFVSSSTKKPVDESTSTGSARSILFCNTTY